MASSKTGSVVGKNLQDATLTLRIPESEVDFVGIRKAFARSRYAQTRASQPEVFG